MKLRQSIIEQAQKEAIDRGKPVIMGNPSGVVAVPGELGRVYVTDYNGHVTKVWNARVPNAPGYPAFVKRLNKRLQVTELNEMFQNFQYPAVGPHNYTHEWGSFGTDVVRVSGDQWLPWRVEPVNETDFTINIYRTGILTSGGWVAASTETYDLASHIPGSGALYVLISVAADGTLVYTDGSTVAAPGDLVASDIPALPIGNRPLYAVILYFGMSPPLQYNPTVTNFIDLRHMEASGGLPTLDPDSIVITDGSGNLITDPNFNYLSGLFVMGSTYVPITNPNDFNIVSDYPAFTTWGNDATAGNAPSFLSIRGRGTLGTPVAVQAGDILARFRGKGWYDGSSVSNSTELRVVANENFSGTNQGTRMELWGTPDGAITPQLMVTVYGDGRIVSANDIEITDAAKGVILKDTVTGTRYRISVTSGAVVATPV